MAKLTISNPKKIAAKDIDQDFNQLMRFSICQIEVPGVGRLRTSERHPDFHLQNIEEPAKSKTSAKGDQAKELTRK